MKGAEHSGLFLTIFCATEFGQLSKGIQSKELKDMYRAS